MTSPTILKMHHYLLSPERGILTISRDTNFSHRESLGVTFTQYLLPLYICMKNLYCLIQWEFSLYITTLVQFWVLQLIPVYIVGANHWWVKGNVTIASDDNFVSMRQCSKPGIKFFDLVNLSIVCKVSSVNEYVTIRDLEWKFFIFHSRMCVTNANYSDLKLWVQCRIYPVPYHGSFYLFVIMPLFGFVIYFQYLMPGYKYKCVEDSIPTHSQTCACKWTFKLVASHKTRSHMAIAADGASLPVSLPGWRKKEVANIRARIGRRVMLAMDRRSCFHMCDWEKYMHCKCIITCSNAGQ